MYFVQRLHVGLPSGHRHHELREQRTSDEGPGMRAVLGVCPAMPHRCSGLWSLRWRAAYRAGQAAGVACADAGRSASVSAKAQVRVIDHPLAAANLSILRAKTTPPDLFRRHLQELSVL